MKEKNTIYTSVQKAVLAGLCITLMAICSCHKSGTVTPKATPGVGILQAGKVYWGACGHRDQGGPFASISVKQQAADLKNIFGNTPNTILYRALGDGQNISDIAADVPAFQAEGIIPIVLVITYPDWTSLANESAAYNWAYSTVAAIVKATPTCNVYEIGNEWVLQDPLFSEVQGDGHTASEWNTCKSYPLYRGAAAGAMAAIRDNSKAQVIGGFLGGWTFQGLAPAIENDLQNYKNRDLTWDFTVEHWYNDANSSNQMGLPDNYNNGMNVYLQLYSAQKPIIFTEFGSSTGNDPSFETQVGTNLVQLMSNLTQHRDPVAGNEPGVAGGCIYQLYQLPGVQTDYYLYNYTGGPTASLSAQGTAVKNWVALHGNPSTGN